MKLGETAPPIDPKALMAGLLRATRSRVKLTRFPRFENPILENLRAFEFHPTRVKLP